MSKNRFPYKFPLDVSRKNFLNGLLFVLTLSFLLNFSVKKQLEFPEDSYRKALFADGAGYYFYNPALFIYKFDSEKFDRYHADHTGGAFYIDTNNKFHSKYSIGVSYLQLPFFLAVHSYAQLKGEKANGFSTIYNLVPAISTSFYVSLGLLLLLLRLVKKYGYVLSLTVLLVIFFGTNLSYYSINVPSFSHSYSFFLFSLLLYFFYGNNLSLITPSHLKNFFIFLICSLVILIRPTNGLFVLALVIIDILTHEKRFAEMKKYLHPKVLILASLALFLIFLPQIVYWKYLSGNFFYSAYTNEGFHYLASPKILAFLIAPNNGMLLYHPLYLLLLLSCIFFTFSHKIERIVFSLTILFLIYLYSSWWVYHFGCSFGSRNFTEYTALLVFPFAAL